MRFDALGLGALDLVRLAASGELRDWILDRERGDRPVTLEPNRPSGARGIDDALALGAALAEVLARGRAAGPSDFGLAGAPDPVAIAALEARGSDSELDDALALLSTDPIAGLRAACLLGVRGAVPAGDPSTEQAQRVASVLVARSDQLHALGVATTDAERTARATARLQLLYGRDLVVLPAFAIPDVGLAASLGDRAALLADPEDAVVWLSNVGAARTGAAALERAVLVADVLGGPDPASQLLVAQLPHVPGDPWIGRAVFQPEPDPELPAPPPQGRRSYVIHAPLGLDLAQPVAGLIVDAFNETVPQAKQTTGIAFQLEQPTACPPQTVLLAVPSDAAPAWTDDAVEAVVREALALAQLRMVDGDLIDAAGQYLPALYFAINLAGDTASTDFTGGT
ncbi:MAG: hypothetical protein ACM31C_13905 [Acidobacteriota bacterium]